MAISEQRYTVAHDIADVLDDDGDCSALLLIGAMHEALNGDWSQISANQGQALLTSAWDGTTDGTGAAWGIAYALGLTDSLPNGLLPWHLRSFMVPWQRAGGVLPVELSAYPNPASDHVLVALPDKVTSGMLEVFDATGGFILRTQVQPEQPFVEWDTRNWDPGILPCTLVGGRLPSGRNQIHHHPVMRSVLIASMFMAGSISAPCQSTFIVQFDSVQAGFGGVGRSIFETSEGYLLFMEARSNDGTFEGRCGSYRLSADGEFLGHTEYDTNQPYSCDFGIFDTVEMVNDGEYVGVVTRYNFAPYVQALWLSHYDMSGAQVNSTLVLSYPAVDSVRLAAHQIRKTSDGGFIFGGFTDSIDTLAKALLVKVESDGSVQWIHSYGSDGDIHEVLGVAEYTGHGLVAIGQYTSVQNHSFLLRTDSVGNQLWRREFGNKADVSGSVRVAPDNAIFTWSEYRELAWEDYYQKLMLTKWDEGGNITWQKRSHYQHNAYAQDFEILPDGGFIAVGKQGLWGALMKFTSEGDSIWTRYLHMFGFGSYYNCYDVETTSDDGFIITGDAFQYVEDPTPGLETIWVIKTDSLGCVIPGCQNVGVQEYVMDLQGHLRVRPNPASELVQVSLDLPEGGEVQGQAQVQLLDGTGRLVLGQEVQQNLNQLRAALDVSTLPSGMYYLHLRDAKRWLAGSKVIVE